MTSTPDHPAPWGLSLWALMERVGAYCYAKDRQGRYTFANDAVCQLFGVPLARVLGHTDEGLFDVARSGEMLAHDRIVLDEGREVHEEEAAVLASGEERVFWSVKVPVRDAQGEITGLFGVSSDITARRQRADALIEHNQMLSAVLANVDAYIYMKDHDGRYLYANQRVLDLYGRASHEILGQADDDLFAPDIAERLMQMDALVMGSAARQAREEVILNPTGEERRFWSIKMPLKLPGYPPALIGFSSDITELFQLRQSLEQQRTMDALTGLANRMQFESELAVDLQLAEREQRTLAVVLLDIDQFKFVNNSLGQAAGDQLLREVAERLRVGCPGAACLARLSGDEFAFTLPHDGTGRELLAAVEQMRTVLAQPYGDGDEAFHITVSAGISLYPADAGDAPGLLTHAEAAMYHAKECGRDQYRFYSDELGAAALDRMALERDLRTALVQQQFELHYQPKIRCSDGGVAGVEALIRWNRKGHGQMSPAQFIPLAEELGLVIQMGQWVVEAACRQIAQWRTDGLGNVPVAVNLSPAQLASPSFPDKVADVLRTHSIVDGCLEMEVTESMMMDNPEHAIAILNALRGLGVRLSIDDFGTGYSSMAYLKRLPVHTLKLDRHFVNHVDSDPIDADLCAGVIALAHKLGLDVVAEGVETQSQRDALAARDCDLFQGYFYSRPLPVEAATRYLAARCPIAPLPLARRSVVGEAMAAAASLS